MFNKACRVFLFVRLRWAPIEASLATEGDQTSSLRKGRQLSRERKMLAS